MTTKKKERGSAEEFFSAALKVHGPALVLGAVKHEGQVLAAAPLALPLKQMNRHGLVAGATGTGKTKTLQVLAEGLSDAGVPVLLMDIKGDISGLGVAGASNPALETRVKALAQDWSPSAYPVEYLTLSEAEPGLRLRATVSEFGPRLLARVLGLNETQASVLAVLFKHCDASGLPVLDLADLKAVLQWAASDEGRAGLAKDAGAVAGATLGTILRKVSALEAEGGTFFGEPSFEVEDLLSVERNGQGLISVLRLADIQDKPQLFSTFMLSLLAEVYHTLPEAGDVDKPRLVIMIDEAHLIFDLGQAALVEELTTMVKLIRSKGVGLYFCTQVPGDVPDEVLSQLGLKVQHALRAFTAKDRQQLKLAAQNYADSPWYDNEELLTSVGTGEAAISFLDEGGKPTPVAHVLLRPPRSRMGTLEAKELATLAGRSPLARKYAQAVDRDSAYERLAKKMESAGAPAAAKAERPSQAQTYASSLMKSAGRTVVNMAVRGLFNALLKRGR